MGLFNLLVFLCSTICCVAVRTELWSETTEISKPGPLGTTVKGWKCNHCNLDAWNRNAARLQFHLSGDAELRDAEKGFSGIDVCSKVPETVAVSAKAELSEKKKDRDSLSKRSAAAADMADTESDERARTMKQTVMSGKPLLKIKADNSVSDYFDGTATPHSAVDSFFFRKMIADIQAVGPG